MNALQKGAGGAALWRLLHYPKTLLPFSGIRATEIRIQNIDSVVK
jgi:hypothetical protein